MRSWLSFWSTEEACSQAVERGPQHEEWTRKEKATTDVRNESLEAATKLTNQFLYSLWPHLHKLQNWPRLDFVRLNVDVSVNGTSDTDSAFLNPINDTSWYLQFGQARDFPYCKPTFFDKYNLADS